MEVGASAISDSVPSGDISVSEVSVVYIGDCNVCCVSRRGALMTQLLRKMQNLGVGIFGKSIMRRVWPLLEVLSRKLRNQVNNLPNQ